MWSRNFLGQLRSPMVHWEWLVDHHSGKTVMFLVLMFHQWHSEEAKHYLSDTITCNILCNNIYFPHAAKQSNYYIHEQYIPYYHANYIMIIIWYIYENLISEFSYISSCYPRPRALISLRICFSTLFSVVPFDIEKVNIGLLILPKMWCWCPNHNSNATSLTSVSL